MNLTSIVLVLQVALQLLVGAQNGTPEQKAQANLFAGQAIQLAMKSLGAVAISTPQTVIVNNYYGASTSTVAQLPVTAASIPAILAKVQLKKSAGDYQYDIENLSTGARASLYAYLFDQYGNPINASATIITDNPKPSGLGFAMDSGVTELNNSPEGHTTFFAIHAYPKQGNAYLFEYNPQTDGQHTITVSALGSTQSLTVQAVTTAQTPAPGTCTLSVVVSGTKATMTWSSKEEGSKNFGYPTFPGELFMEYASPTGTKVWWPESLGTFGGEGTFPYFRDGWGMGLESTSTTGGLGNATNFKLVYADGTTCYAK